MYIAKSRVLIDKDRNCVKDGDPKGVEVLAGFKGAKVSEKIISKVKGAEAFFDPDNISKPREAAPSKRVIDDPEPTHSRPATIHQKK